MSVQVAASCDALHLSSVVQAEDETHRPPPRRAAQSRRPDNAVGSRLFHGLASSICLSALLAVGAAGAATARTSDVVERAVPDQPARDAVPEFGLAPVSVVEAAPIPIAADGAASAAQEAVAAAADEPAAHADGEPQAEAQAGSAQDISDADEAQADKDPDELLRFGAMQVPRWIVDTIIRAAEEAGVDPVYMMALADKESSFLVDNKAATSTAVGLFQFVAGTWLEVVRNYGAQHGLIVEAASIQNVGGQLTIPDESMRAHVLGLRRDPYLSALMAAEMLKRDRERIERRIGRRVSRSELYFAHFLGANSAGKLMALLYDKPKQSASRVFPAAAKANRSLFFAKKGRKTRQVTVAELYDKIDDMIDKRLDRYEEVTALATIDASL